MVASSRRAVRSFTRQPPFPSNQTPGEPFRSSQEAWIWAMTCLVARDEGARFGAGRGQTPRPCEPVDLLRVLDALVRQGHLHRGHAKVLQTYGRRLTMPDDMVPGEAKACRIWHEAMDRMTAPLRRKGIVEMPDPPPASSHPVQSHAPSSPGQIPASELRDAGV